VGAGPPGPAIGPVGMEDSWGFFLPFCSDKKENKIFLIYKEIQMGSGAKSYMMKGFLIYEDMHKYFHHL
jgi:hypothetical protein